MVYGLLTPGMQRVEAETVAACLKVAGFAISQSSATSLKREGLDRVMRGKRSVAVGVRSSK
jgi:hypothetical protein